MILSPFTPIFFEPRKGDNGVPSHYMQTWGPTDRIHLQLIGTTVETPPETVVFDRCSGQTLYTIEWSEWDMNGTDLLCFADIMGLTDGCYHIIMEGVGTSEPFRVTSKEAELNQTTLIQYSNRDNRQRDDAVFIIDNMPNFFDFRVPGGFKDNGWQFGVENEQFVTDAADIVELFGIESTAKTLTMGEGDGVPIWFGELLNRLLTCNFVYFDGVRYARKEASVPEVNATDELLNSFIITQVVQKVARLDPVIETSNHIAMRRLDSEYYRSAPIDNENINRLII